MTVDLSDLFEDSPFLVTPEVSPLRAQALDLLDRCLTDGNRSPIVNFIERQIMLDPPDLQLLQEIADDLQQRLITLRANQFEARENVIRAFGTCEIDITPIMPARALHHYHQLETTTLINFAQQQKSLLPDETQRLTGIVQGSLDATKRLHRDIQITTELQNMVLDWLDALITTLGRSYGNEDAFPTTIIQ